MGAGELFTPESRCAPYVTSAEGDAMSASRRLTALTRFGFAARGLLYIAIALLVIAVDGARTPSGALAELGRSGGDPLLLAMAAGFIAYGLWRFADAALNIEFHDAGAKGSANDSPRPAAERPICSSPGRRCD